MAVGECHYYYRSPSFLVQRLQASPLNRNSQCLETMGLKSINTSGTHFSNNLERINTHYVNGRIDSRIEVLWTFLHYLICSCWVNKIQCVQSVKMLKYERYRPFTIVKPFKPNGLKLWKSWLRYCHYSCVVTDSSCSQLEEPKMSQGPIQPSLEAKSCALEEAQCSGGGWRRRLSLPFARRDVACVGLCSVSEGPNPSVCSCISLCVTFWGSCQDVCGTLSETLYAGRWTPGVSACGSGTCPFMRDISIPKRCKEFFLEREKVRTNAEGWDMFFLKPLLSSLSLAGPDMDLNRADTLNWDSRLIL